MAERETLTMLDDLLTPLGHIITAADDILTKTALDDELQRKFIHSIFTVATDMRDLVFATPDLTWDKARIIFSYESRQHLASIIGYAEVMLEEDEGVLNNDQRRRLITIHKNGKVILKRLLDISGDSDEE
jgi:hypothetical protein